MQLQSAKEQRIIAPDMSRALRKLSDELGPDAVLLSSRKLPNGVEIIALPAGAKPSNEDFSVLHSDRRNGDRRAKDRRSNALSRAVSANDNSELSDEVGNTSNGANHENKVHSAASRLAQSIGELKSPFSDTSAFENLQQELQEVKQMLEAKMATPKTAEPIMPNPVQYTLINRLLDIGLPLAFARTLSDGLDVYRDVNSNMDNQTAVDQAWQVCLSRLEAMIPIANDDIVAEGGVIAFAGPCGAGKSSAISKLATRWLLEHSAKDIAIISHDAASEAGAGRMSRFSSMTGIPVFYVDKKNPLTDRLAQCAKCRLVLIDTVSLSAENPSAQQDLDKLSLLSQVKTLTVLPATGDRRWVTRAINAYRQANSVGCVLTHMDQVDSLGELLTVLLAEKVTINYLSDGGLLPKYIQPPQRALLMQKLFKRDGMDKNEGYMAVPTIKVNSEDETTLASG